MLPVQNKQETVLPQLLQNPFFKFFKSQGELESTPPPPTPRSINTKKLFAPEISIVGEDGHYYPLLPSERLENPSRSLATLRGPAVDVRQELPRQELQKQELPIQEFPRQELPRQNLYLDPWDSNLIEDPRIRLPLVEPNRLGFPPRAPTPAPAPLPQYQINLPPPRGSQVGNINGFYGGSGLLPQNWWGPRPLINTPPKNPPYEFDAAPVDLSRGFPIGQQPIFGNQANFSPLPQVPLPQPLPLSPSRPVQLGGPQSVATINQPEVFGAPPPLLPSTVVNSQFGAAPAPVESLQNGALIGHAYEFGPIVQDIQGINDENLLLNPGYPPLNAQNGRGCKWICDQDLIQTEDLGPIRPQELGPFRPQGLGIIKPPQTVIGNGPRPISPQIYQGPPPTPQSFIEDVIDNRPIPNPAQPVFGQRILTKYPGNGREPLCCTLRLCCP